MTGQEAVNVAQAFQERVAFDGVVLTKLDGDARGGAALSVKAVTGAPIKLASTGEKLDQLEWFHPDRMASRILGMGDVLTLIEKAEEAVEADEQAEMEKRMRAGEFTFDDFLASYKMLRRMGSLKGVLSMIPGIGNQLKGLEIDERELGRVEAMILSMTPRERGYPHTIDGSRRQRIARGSGTTVQEVSRLLNARKEMQKLMKRMGQGKMPTLPQMTRRKGMAVRMRLTRVGSKKNPSYRVVVADSRSPRDGKFIEIVGRYNPQTDPSLIEFDEAKVKDWLSKGVQPSDAVSRLLKVKNIG